MHIYLKNNHGKFYPNLLWNDGALGFLKTVPPVSDPIIYIYFFYHRRYTKSTISIVHESEAQLTKASPQLHS